MGRLIDADLLKQCYTGKNSLGTNNNNSKADYASIRKMIDNQPTAYDVDKVTEQLQQMKARYFLTIANTGNETLDKIYEDVGNSIDKAIEIVKGGGQG